MTFKTTHNNRTIVPPSGHHASLAVFCQRWLSASLYEPLFYTKLPCGTTRMIILIVMLGLMRVSVLSSAPEKRDKGLLRRSPGCFILSERKVVVETWDCWCFDLRNKILLVGLTVRTTMFNFYFKARLKLSVPNFHNFAKKKNVFEKCSGF